MKSKPYSYLRAVLGPEDPELAVSEAIAAAINRPCAINSVYVPWIHPDSPQSELSLSPRMALDSTSSAGGGFTVETEKPSLITLLQPRCQTIAAGLKVVPGCKGNLGFPRILSPNTLKWQTENSGSDDAESDVTYGLASGSPKTATATAVFSAQLAVQSPELAVAGLFAELADVFAVGIDAAVLGSGGPGAPAGLLSAASIAAGVTVIAAGDPDGGAISYSKLVDQEAAIGASNVPEDPLTTAFIASPTQRQKLRKVAVNGVGSKMCWTVSDDDDSDRLIARRARVTKDCMSGIAKGSGSNLEAVYFGDWSHGMLLMWGGLELIVDRYSLKKQSLVEVTGTAFLDFVLLHGGAFSVIADAA